VCYMPVKFQNECFMYVSQIETQRRKTINPIMTYNVNFIEKPKTSILYLILHKFYEYILSVYEPRVL